jgi:GT2 family glycosyltransferase
VTLSWSICTNVNRACTVVVFSGIVVGLDNLELSRLNRQSDYSIVIPFHSNVRLLSHCLKTLLATVPTEVEKILVLNNHRDTALPPAIDLSDFRVIVREESMGYPAAVNLGASLATGKTLIFCDSDTFYVDPWFPGLTCFHRSMPNIGMAGSRLLDPQTGRVLDFGVAFTKYNAPHPQRDLRPHEPSVTKPRKVQAACSANMIIDAKLFSQVGMFDEDLCTSYCDLDLCMRLNDMGRDCWVFSASTVFHQGGSADDHHSIYKNDVKALFAARNSQRIRLDMQKYFQESMSAYAASRGFANGYLLVDLSTVIDRNWHYEILREHVNLISIYDYSLNIRDLSTISLIDCLGINILESRLPILYFSDRFTALAGNRMWFQMRCRQDDLIVDRNANVALFAEAVNGLC